MSLYHSTNWSLDSAILVLPYVPASPTVPASVDGVRYAGYTALGGIVYLILTSVLP